jgi:hypothetical protein
VPNVLPLADPFIALAVAIAALAGQISPGGDPMQATRLRLEAERQELLTTIRDRPWMQDQGRASLARLSVERGWKQCAANEAAALAITSEKPARLLAEAALATCHGWELALDLALQNGAYPYVDDRASHPSREDMVALAALESRDAAIARILLWRGNSPASATIGGNGQPREGTDRRAGLPAPGGALPVRPAIRPSATAPAAAVPPAAAKSEAPPTQEEGQTITVTATRRGGCRVRLADRTLTDRQLAANAKQWAADGTPLRVVRPAGADYHCMAKIAWRLGEHGVRLFHFVDPPATQ